MSNPYYADDRTYRINCQRCVWAYELNRRGYEVEADRHDSSDYVGSIAGIKEMYMNAPNAKRSDYYRLDLLEPGSTKRQYEKVKELMSTWGEGSRAILANLWDTGGGHIWNVEYLGGKVHYFDAQIGREVDPIERNSRSRTLDIFARTDTLDIPLTVYKAVRIRKDVIKKNRTGRQ